MLCFVIPFCTKNTLHPTVVERLCDCVLERHRFLSINDLSAMPKPSWAIEGMFELNTLVMLAGPPASYKSFMALDWLLCMASGRDWNGKKTVPNRVLYVLGEGKSSLLKRIQAWQHYHKPSEEECARAGENFRVTFDVPQMAVKASVDNLLAALETEEYKPNVICVDTFARSFVGLDENSPQDIGLWIESAERLRAAGYTVIFLHHTKKNTEFGVQYRGSTAILGAMDTAMTMIKVQHVVTLNITKQKDHDEGDPLHFNGLLVKPDPKNDPEGSIVLTPTIMVDDRFSDSKQKEHETLVRMCAQHPEFSNGGIAELMMAEFSLPDKKYEAMRSRVQQYRASQMPAERIHIVD